MRALPWFETMGTWTRWFAVGGSAQVQDVRWYDTPPAQRPEPPARVWYSAASGTWRASVQGSQLVHNADPDLPGEWDTVGEARDAADRVLVDMGWTLEQTASAQPTAADILAWLQANPDEAMKVLGQVKVLGPWEQRQCGCCLYRTTPGDDEVLGLTRDADGTWHDLFQPSNGSWPDLDAAKAALDAEALAEGWALAGGAR